MEAENAEGEEGADGEIDEAMIIVSWSYAQHLAHQPSIASSLRCYGHVTHTRHRSPTRPQKERSNGRAGRRSQMRFE